MWWVRWDERIELRSSLRDQPGGCTRRWNFQSTRPKKKKKKKKLVEVIVQQPSDPLITVWRKCAMLCFALLTGLVVTATVTLGVWGGLAPFIWPFSHPPSSPFVRTFSCSLLQLIAICSFNFSGDRSKTMSGRDEAVRMTISIGAHWEREREKEKRDMHTQQIARWRRRF